MSIKQINVNKFDTIAEDLRDLPNGQFHYFENVNVGDFSNSVKQVPNVYLKDNDQCILKLVKYGTGHAGVNGIYGIGYENSTTSDVTLYKWDDGNNIFVALTNGTVAGGTIRLYAPFFAIMDGYIYFDPGTNYIARFKLSDNTMSSTWKSHNNGMSGGTNWQGDLYGWCDVNNNVYKISSNTKAGGTDAVTSMIVIPNQQTIVEIVPNGNYLEIICTASQTSDDGISRMYTWDGVTTTTFTDITEIGYGIVSGADVLDGLIYAVIGFPNRKGFRIKAYSGGVFQTVYTYFGKKNEVSDYIYCQPASVVKSYTGYLYFMVVGSRPGSLYTGNYEAVLMRYGRKNAGQNYKLSVYKSLEVIPSIGNTIGNLGNDFIVFEDISAVNLIDNLVYAVIYEAGYKTRQVYTNTTTTYSSQPGIIETGIYTGGDSSKEKSFVNFTIKYVPLISGQSITVKMRKDAETSWTTIATRSTVGEISRQITNNEITGKDITSGKEFQFRIELLGGAEFTGYSFEFEEQI